MIKDLEGKNSFYYLDPIYIKYFVTKKVSLAEQEKLSSMRSLISISFLFDILFPPWTFHFLFSKAFM